MSNYGHGLVGYILTLISLIHGSFVSVISFIVVIILIYHQYNNRLKREQKITLILSINIYILICIYSITLTSVNIQTLLGDMYESNFNLSWCIFRGYFICLMCSSLYYAFVIQAFYRLCRIVYSHHGWLQHFWFYVVSTPIQIIVASVVLCPLLILHDIIYLPNDRDCFVSFINARGILYALFISYGLPLIILSLIYTRITLFIRQQPHNLAATIQRRQKQDLLAIQRILTNVSLLVIVGMPGIIFLIMSWVTGEDQALSYRVTWMGAEISIAILSVEMVYMTPQLKNIVMKKVRQNRVTTIEGSLQMRPTAIAH